MPSISPPPFGANANNSANLNASESIRRLKESSRKLMKQSQQIGSAAGAASTQAIMAVWAMVMAIIRFIAKVFGPKRNQAESVEKTEEIEDDFAKPKASQANLKVGPAALAQQHVDKSLDASIHPENAIGLMAGEAHALLKKLEDQPDAGALLQALDYAGIDDAALMLEWVEKMGDPSALKGPDHVIEAALNKGLEALVALERRTLLARSVRSEQAAKLSAKFAPPMLLEDLVSMYRTGLEKGRIPSVDMPSVTALIQADDALQNILGHSSVIRETLTVAAASAKKAGVTLDGKALLLQRVLGADWAKKIDVAYAEIQLDYEPDHPGVTQVFNDLMGKIAPPVKSVVFPTTLAPDVNGATQITQVADLPKPLISDRLRIASAAANRFLQGDRFFGQSNRNDSAPADDMGPKL